MLKKTIADALNDQIQKELYSSYLYLAMAAAMEDQNLPGFASWLTAQASEEHAHAMRIYKYLNDQGARVILQAIEQPPKDFGEPREMFEEVLKHEQKVTASIHTLYELSLKEKDYPTQTFLQWFINEQVEEEKSATDVLNHLQALEEHKHALLILDRRMGDRKG